MGEKNTMKNSFFVLHIDEIKSEKPIRRHERPGGFLSNRKTHKVDYYSEEQFDMHIPFAILKCH